MSTCRSCWYPSRLPCGLRIHEMDRYYFNATNIFEKQICSRNSCKKCYTYLRSVLRISEMLQDHDVSRLLGCTDRRAGLGIHRTQAGRSGSSFGRGQRAEARRTTTSPATYSVTSATDPAAPRPGGATRVLDHGPARVGNHRHRSRPPQRARARCPTVTVPGPPERARERCPAEDYSASSGEPASVTVPGRRSVPGPVPARTAVRRGPGGH
jgi:hypothetical protein